MAEDQGERLECWQGRFGDEYIERNAFADWKLEPGVTAWRRMIGGLEMESVLEVGSNIGLNLHFINHLFRGQVRLFAVEPNRKACQALAADERLKLAGLYNTSAFELPLADQAVDLAFTAGVLIHIGPEDLPRAVDEIVRVSRRFVLCVEYFAHEPMSVPYRGRSGLLFKRDFGAFYQERHPALACRGYGFLWQRELPIFDNMNWWLFEKPPA